MIREGISFDLLRNIKFVSKIEGNEVTCFSFDRMICLEVVYDQNTRLIKSIKINNVYVDVTMHNISILNKVYANETNHVDLTITDPSDSYSDGQSGFGGRRR